MKSRASFCVLFVLLLITVTTWLISGRTPANKARSFDSIPIDLLPVDKARPVTFDDARVTGALEIPDRKELEFLVGRIPYVRGRVDSVITCWDENVVAAKISRGDRWIYCTRSTNGEWHVVSFVLYSKVGGDTKK